MTLSERIEAFIKLGNHIDELSNEELDVLTSSARAQNGWFDEENVRRAFSGISHFLKKEALEKWIAGYSIEESVPKIVGIVMAGNIPLVGFHDLLCVLISGNFAAIKPSSDDLFLTQKVVEWLTDIEPRFKKNFEFRDKLTNIDAVIATGSDNTSRYFEYYFKNIPNVIRKNRTSVAVLTGKESPKELADWGNDIFSYYGLGCRNVSKVFTPKGFDLRDTFEHLQPFENVIHHHKYRNNYDYHKSIYLVNKTPHLDTGFLLAITTDELVSPISVLFHQEYEDQTHLNRVLDSFEEKIQCIVGHEYIPFGHAQTPELWDYADNIDVIDFLIRL